MEHVSVLAGAGCKQEDDAAWWGIVAPIDDEINQLLSGALHIRVVAGEQRGGGNQAVPRLLLVAQ